MGGSLDIGIFGINEASKGWEELRRHRKEGNTSFFLRVQEQGSNSMCSNEVRWLSE